MPRSAPRLRSPIGPVSCLTRPVARTRRVEDDASARPSAGSALAYRRRHDPLADTAPSLLRVLHETDPNYVLVDGTLAECEIGDGRG